MATTDTSQWNTTVSPPAPANIPVIRGPLEASGNVTPQGAATSWQTAMAQATPQAGLENPNKLPK